MVTGVLPFSRPVHALAFCIAHTRVHSAFPQLVDFHRNVIIAKLNAPALSTTEEATEKGKKSFFCLFSRGFAPRTFSNGGDNSSLPVTYRYITKISKYDYHRYQKINRSHTRICTSKIKFLKRSLNRLFSHFFWFNLSAFRHA